MVYLVGAGPGDSGLITCRGKELLEQCDAVIYDRLGTNELLEFLPETCERIYVGKQPGAHSKTQEEINEILIIAAKKYSCVVRLKGGDPFVFGRGGEEVLALQQAEIPFQLVPGVTSAIAVPELLGIPVTHRAVSRGFHVFTGHTKGDEKQDYSYIHKEEGTSIFLMGLRHLEKIVGRLFCEGVPEETPAAVISKGTLPGEAIVRGSLSDIVDKVKEAKLESPAIILVGENAGYHFYSRQMGPLYRKKIGVIGTSALRENIRCQLVDEGACVYSLCNMKVKKTDAYPELEKEFEQIEQYTWICFTSQNSVRLFFEAVREYHFDMRKLSHIRFAVLGSGTGNALAREGFQADYMPEEYTTKALAEGMVELLKQEGAENPKLFIPRALQGSEEFVNILKEHQIAFKILPIYDVIGKRTDNWKYLYDFDSILFASASGVMAFFKELGIEHIKMWDQKRQKAHIKIATIGHITARTLKKYGVTVDVIPAQCDVPGLIQALKQSYLQDDKGF